MSDPQPIQVVAGLIAQDRRYLITRRKQNTDFPGIWEFPGGKREPGESLEECLRRELREELGIEISPPLPYRVVRHAYPGKEVALYFFFCYVAAGQPQALGCDEFRWVFPKDLPDFEFPAADRPIIEALARPRPRR